MLRGYRFSAPPQERSTPEVENVANQGDLPPTGSWVIALPMKIAGGSGGPVRIVALVPKVFGG